MTITSIVLIILVLIAAGALIVLVVPFTFMAEFNVSSAGQSGVMHAQWLHPWIARWKYDIEQRRSEIRVLGWTRVFQDKGTAETKAEESPVPHLDKPVTDVAQPAGFTVENEYRKETGLEEKPRIDTKPVDPEVSGWQKVKNIYSILRDLDNKKVFAKALCWCRRLFLLCFKIVSFHRFRLHTKAGAGDPAETGKIYGYYVALERSCFSLHQNVDVSFSPEFTGDMFACDGGISFRTSFIRVLLPLLVALVTFPYLTAYFVWRRFKKHESSNYNKTRYD